MRLRIDAFMYDVKFVSDRILMGDETDKEALGMTESYLKLITVSMKEVCKTSMLQTLMHEIMHAIQNERMLPECKGQKNEELIEGFANGILQVLMDNPELTLLIVNEGEKRYAPPKQKVKKIGARKYQ